MLAPSEHAQDELLNEIKALEKLSNEHQKLRNRVSDLNKEARKLRRRVRRMERRVSTSGATNGSGSNVWRIFINLPQEQIEHWIYDLACKLIFDHRLPGEEGLGAICDILQAMAAVGTDDDIDPSASPNGEEGEGPGVGEASVTEEPDAAAG